MKPHLSLLLIAALKQLATEQVISADLIPPAVKLEHTKDPAHGDFASNIALVLAKKVGMPPLVLAEKIVQALPSSSEVAQVVVATPGFINITLAKDAHTNIIQRILREGACFGESVIGAGQRIHIEYVSANPTGPLHVGHGRSAAYGSCVVNLLRATGFSVHNEYYINDAGRQMNILAVSVWLRYLELYGASFVFPSNGYKGDYVVDIARSLQASEGNHLLRSIEAVFQDVPADEPLGGDKERHIDALIQQAKSLLGPEYVQVFNFGLQSILEDIKADLAEFRVTYDEWFSEKKLMENHLVQHCIEVLSGKKHLYTKEGALWFNTTAYGDDKDRVVCRANGETTYFASDIAYHLNKLERGYVVLIDILGADHHGYIPRLKAAIHAMTEQENVLITPIVQFVSLYRGREKMAMSTRSGEFVTLRALREEVGVDATRYFYIMRKIDQPLDFDLELAQSHSNDNPVYYIQYAHARICSVWRQLQVQEMQWDSAEGLRSLSALVTAEEIALCKHLHHYPEVVEKAALSYEPHLLAHYLHELAHYYHSYYATSKCLIEDNGLRNARLCLNKAAQQVLVNGLGLLGISAPDSM